MIILLQPGAYFLVTPMLPAVLVILHYPKDDILFHFNLVYLVTLTSEAEKVLYHQWPHEADFLLVQPDRTTYEK